MAFKIKDLMINVLPSGPEGIGCGPGGTCTALTPECGSPTEVCGPGAPATCACSVLHTKICGVCTEVACTHGCTATCGGCTATCGCTALCTHGCTGTCGVCSACSACTATCHCSVHCTATCNCSITCQPCTERISAGCTVHTNITPQAELGPSASFAALSSLKEQLKQQLAAVEKQHAAAADSLLPQSVEEVDMLSKKLQDALDELKSRRAELTKKPKPAGGK